MSHDHVTSLSELLDRTHPSLGSSHTLECKSFFGAANGYIDGHVFITIGKFGVALKLPPDILKRLFDEKDVQPLKYFPKGHVKKDYAVLPSRIVEDLKVFKKLLDQCIEFALNE